MGAIVKCLSDVKNIGEGRTEEMQLALTTYANTVPGATGAQASSRASPHAACRDTYVDEGRRCRLLNSESARS